MILELKARLQRDCPTLELREQEPLSRHTSFRIGGPISLMALPKTEEQAVLALRAAANLGVHPFFLGKGSNLLVADEGFSGFAIKYVSEAGSMTRVGDDALCAGAGVTLAQLAVFAMEHALTGLEFAHGIPGSLGGGVFMNAGAYEGEMAQVVREVHTINLKGEKETFLREQCDFGYRHSIFSDETRLILAVRCTLCPGVRDEINDKMRLLMEKRRSKQPLEFPSGGSTFRRPAGQFAGALIEQAGLKGFAIGGAQVSEKHAGFVINRGGATCRDVLQLIREVKRQVFEQSGLRLEPELRLLGCTWTEDGKG